jgi:PAS domain-containing protein
MPKELRDRLGFLRAILDALPSYVFVTDHSARIVHTNRAASRLLGILPEAELKGPFGETLRCMRAFSPEGCGHGEQCSGCVIRKGVEAAQGGQTISQQRTRMKLRIGSVIREVEFLVSASPLSFTGPPFVLVVLEDITQLRELSRLLPMCSGCKKIRDDEKYWEDVACYLSKHTDLRFTHGFCPECARKYFPELAMEGLV